MGSDGPGREAARPGPPDTALSVRGLRKAFGSKLAVAGIDLDIPHGCFFGLVGPNGAGKTTTLSMVTGLLRPDAGLVAVDGVEVWRDPFTAKQRIGVLPEDLRLFERLTGDELLTYNGLLRNMPPATVTERASELLEVLGLTDAAGTLVADYSHGMPEVSTNLWAAQGVGQGCTTGLVQMVALMVQGILILPIAVLVGVGIFVWWPALVVVCPFAVGYGLALWWAGVRAGSDWLRAHAPELLAALKPSRAA